MKHFYMDAPTDMGYPLRIDLLLIYDRDQLVPRGKGRPGNVVFVLGSSLSCFDSRTRRRRPEALLGLVKIPSA